MKILETIFLLILVAIIMAAGNTIGYQINFIDSLQVRSLRVHSFPSAHRLALHSLNHRLG